MIVQNVVTPNPKLNECHLHVSRVIRQHQFVQYSAPIRSFRLGWKYSVNKAARLV
jgi:hypothetical protein